MIYLDYHSTTPCDPRVLEAMLPFLHEQFGNPHSSSHEIGRQANEAMQDAIGCLAQTLGASSDQLIMTSGATESITLALRGTMTHPRMQRKHIVAAATEHSAVLDTMADLQRDGFDTTVVPCYPQGHAQAGQVNLDALADAIRADTAIVNVMLANNEMGAIAELGVVAEMTHAAGALLHCDATQAIGRFHVNVVDADIDLLSASAHKFYGPKGTGLLIAGNGNRRVRLRALQPGGGQQQRRRGGTMNPPAIIAMARALQLASDDLTAESVRMAHLRNRLWNQLNQAIDGLQINGPALSASRLDGNLNFQLKDVEGEAWMAATPDVAFSSGSACSSVEAKPSHVLTALGLSESQARRSVRFGVGRFTTEDEIDRACESLIRSHQKLTSG